MFDCCNNLIECIERKELPFYPQYRGVCYYFLREDGSGFGEYFLRYCPFCGAKMPKHFYASDEYYDAIEEALGKESCDIKEEEIPEEFKTDEWWIKRGL